MNVSIGVFIIFFGDLIWFDFPISKCGIESIHQLNEQSRLKIGCFDLLGIMVISWSLVTVHHAMYDCFEHLRMLRWVSISLGKLSFTSNVILIVH